MGGERICRQECGANWKVREGFGTYRGVGGVKEDLLVVSREIKL